MFKDSKRNPATDTLIGQGTHVEGKIVCETNLRIEGDYRGDIECSGDVIVGESGLVRSTIEARDVIIAGKVFGDIVTKGRLTITPSGMLVGNVTAQSFVLQDGGILNGTCQMDLSQEPRTQPLAEPEQPAQPAPMTAKEAAAAAKELAREKARQAG